MKKIDKDPTHKELIDLIVANPIGRNADLVSMTETIFSTEGGMTYFLDGDWGSGKTFFVKQLKIVLEALNPNTENDDEMLRVLDSPEIAELQGCKDGEAGSSESGCGEAGSRQSLPYLPIYYNAWENDHWDDPLPSIIQTIAWQAGGSGKVDAGDPIEKFGGIVGNILKAANLGFVSETCKTISGESLLQQYKDRLKIRHYIRQLIEKALDGRDEKMLLIIDELDRCRPVFALKLLEQVKNVFGSEKLVVLYAVNTDELSKTAECQYGSGFDGARYLSRFYDERFTLFPPEGATYLAYSGIPNDSWRSHSIAHEMKNALRMSLRDQNRYASSLMRIEKLRSTDPGEICQATFVENALAVLLSAVEVARQTDFVEIINLRGGDKVFECACMSESFLAYLDLMIRDRRHLLTHLHSEFEDLFEERFDVDGSEAGIGEDLRRELVEKSRRLFLNGFLTLMFDVDQQGESYREAYRLINDGSFGYRRLDLIAKRLFG